jgi:hypothetical protein
MNKTDRLAWASKTQKVNHGKTLEVGDLVKVLWGNLQTGTVIDIQTWPDEPLSPENHGCVTIQLASGIEEHFPYYGWQNKIRKI